MIYLASPYISQEQTAHHIRYHHACRSAAKLIEQGHVVFSPIAHSHGIARFIKEHDHDFWMNQDLPFLKYADKIVVLTLPGWEKSRGIKEEIEFANKNGIPVEYMEPENER